CHRVSTNNNCTTRTDFCRGHYLLLPTAYGVPPYTPMPPWDTAAPRMLLMDPTKPHKPLHSRPPPSPLIEKLFKHTKEEVKKEGWLHCTIGSNAAAAVSWVVITGSHLFIYPEGGKVFSVLMTTHKSTEN